MQAEQEVVLWYEGQSPEVVEYYVHPDPLPHQPPPKQKWYRRLRPKNWRCRKKKAKRYWKPKSHRKGWKVFLLAVGLTLLSLFCGIFFGIRLYEKQAGEPLHWNESNRCFIPRASLDDTVRLSYQTEQGKVLTPAQVYERVIYSTVTILAYEGRGMSIGTGVLFTEDGYLLTNAHVIENSEFCMVYLADGTPFEAELVGLDSAEDLAVLKIHGHHFIAAEFGDSDALAVGDAVYAIGNPLGTELIGTFTNGIVSALQRVVRGENADLTVIQTNAALNSGNSGGPLINASGQVVGINTMKMSSDRSNVEGLGFALPVSDFCYKVNQLLAYGEIREEPILGFQVRSQAGTAPNGQAGFEILSITAGLGADQAGLQAGDWILSVEGQPMQSVEQLMQLRRTRLSGESLSLGICRGESQFTVSLTLQEAPLELPHP